MERGLENISRPLPQFMTTETSLVIPLHWINFSIVGREDHNLMRLIKESIYIRVNNPSLNRDIGKYQLPHIWDEFSEQHHRT